MWRQPFPVASTRWFSMESTSLSFAGGATSYPFRLAYGFADGRRYELETRIFEVWERRPGGYRIVHEHPSTVHDLEHS